MSNDSTDPEISGQLLVTDWATRYMLEGTPPFHEIRTDGPVLPPSDGTELFFNRVKYRVTRSEIAHTIINPPNNGYGLIVQVTVFVERAAAE